MIEFFRNWCEGIIVAVMISIIIESILPEGNHKKYVKVVIGIYIIFTILNPILTKLNSNVDFSKQLDLKIAQSSTVPDEKSIRDLYASGLEQTLKNEIEENFEVQVNALKIQYDENYETIESITLFLQSSGVLPVEKVEIGNQSEEEQQEEKDYPEVRKYISENYGLEKNKVIFQ